MFFFSYFLFRFRLREHYRTHTNERPFECNICEKKFHKFNQLKQHQAIHINARKHKCHICGKGFNRRGNMVIHSQRHLKNQLLCKICGDMFTSLKELLAHRNSHPKGEIDAVLKELSEKVTDFIKLFIKLIKIQSSTI